MEKKKTIMSMKELMEEIENNKGFQRFRKKQEQKEKRCEATDVRTRQITLGLAIAALYVIADILLKAKLFF